MRHLNLGGDAAHQHILVAPVELEGFARRKAQQHEGVGHARRPRLPPPPGIVPHAVVAAGVSRTAKVVEGSNLDADLPAQGVTFARRSTYGFLVLGI